MCSDRVTNPAERGERRLFILDTNVLMHDPACVFRFAEHDIVVPMIVLEELDHAKKGTSELARNVRQVSRVLDELIGDRDWQEIERGLPLDGTDPGAGRLYFQSDGPMPSPVPGAPADSPDNGILALALGLEKSRPQRRVTLVSKDINLRIKARVLGIHSEDYTADKVLDDVSLLPTGIIEVADELWQRAESALRCWQDGGRTFYEVPGAQAEDWHPGACLRIGTMDAIVVRCDEHSATLVAARDYRKPGNNVWGITSRNSEQSFALNLLMDPGFDFVSLLGTAGTGKTLLALASGLAQTLDQRRYREIVVTRVTVPVGEDIGFLPGTEEEKMTPWMGALMDNLEVLTESTEDSEWNRAAAEDLLHKRLKVRSLNFMRGRTFLNRYVIIDEAQNLTRKQMKTLVTRAGQGTKIVCIGNVAQIDTPYLSETTSGLTYAIDRFTRWAHSAHVTLQRGERSRLADFAADNL